MIWSISKNGNNYFIENNEPRYVLYGHDSEVTCVSIYTELDVVVSGSLDGSIVIHTIRKGNYVHSLYHPKRLPFYRVSIAPQNGNIVAYSQNDLKLFLFSINGFHLTTIELNERFNDFFLTRNADFIVTGGKIKYFSLLKN